MCIFTSPEPFRWLSWQFWDLFFYLAFDIDAVTWTFQGHQYAEINYCPKGTSHTKWHLLTSNTWTVVSDSGRKPLKKGSKNKCCKKCVCNIMTYLVAVETGLQAALLPIILVTQHLHCAVVPLLDHHGVHFYALFLTSPGKRGSTVPLMSHGSLIGVKYHKW